MIKAIVKMLLPSDERLAKKAVAEIRESVNGQDEATKSAIVKYATLANDLAAIGQTISDVLKDGNVDEVESETLVKLITPLFAKAREVVGI